MPGIQDTFDHIVRSHRIVRDAVRALLQARDADAAREHLAALAEVLPEHFAYEESANGYFAHLRAHLSARHQGAVDELVVEHREMATEIQALLEGSAGDDWLARAHELGRKLHAHEQREARLGATPIEPGL